ncbi:MAG: SWIM zinc finger family protein [Woeseia sp.]
MKELKFLVKGSAPQPYELVFIKDGDSLTAICNCPAGEHGNFCKHRIGLLDGKPKGLTSDNAEEVATVVEWLVGTDVETALRELRVVEKDKTAPKADLVAAKKKLARAMNS